MKVAVAAANLKSVRDCFFRFSPLASLRQHHGFHAGHRSTLVLRIFLEELLNQRRGFLVSPQSEQSVGGVKRQQRWVHFEWSAVEDLKGLLVFGPAHIDDAQPVSRQSIARIDSQRLFNLSLSLVEQADVKINESQLMMRFIEVRI